MPMRAMEHRYLGTLVCVKSDKGCVKLLRCLCIDRVAHIGAIECDDCHLTLLTNFN